MSISNFRIDSILPNFVWFKNQICLKFVPLFRKKYINCTKSGHSWFFDSNLRLVLSLLGLANIDYLLISESNNLAESNIRIVVSCAERQKTVKIIEMFCAKIENSRYRSTDSWNFRAFRTCSSRMWLCSGNTQRIE